MGKFRERCDSRLERFNGNRIYICTCTLSSSPLVTRRRLQRRRQSCEAISRNFQPLFPRGAYFAPKMVPMLGPQKLIDVHPVIQFQLKTNVTGAFAWDWYWRESTHDGIYAFGSGLLIDPASTSRARYLGNQGDLEIRWAPVRHVTLAFNRAGFKPGTFFNILTYNAAPIEGNVGFTYPF